MHDVFHLKFIGFSSQTLTTLGLFDNAIEVEGAKHLANALPYNKVIKNSIFLLPY